MRCGGVFFDRGCDDMAFTARGVATQLVQIQRVNALHRALVISMRREAVKTVVNTLRQRYRVHLRREETTLTFIDWLIEREVFEHTFWHAHGTGFSLAERRRMSIRYHDFFERKELRFANEEEDPYWAIVAIESLVNAKRWSSDPVLGVSTQMRDAIPKRGLKQGVTFAFYANDPVERSADDWLRRFEEALDGKANPYDYDAIAVNPT